MHTGVLLTIAVLVAAAASVELDDPVSDELRISNPLNPNGYSGKYITSSKGRGVAAFYGIPYSRKLLKHMRFKEPQNAHRWLGYMDNTVEREGCSRPASKGRRMSTNEDCLYLNVFRPLHPKTKGLLPVMVFFDERAFIDESTFVEPDYFLDHDVVLVTGKYRTGVMGFLSTGQTMLGNNGLKDQRQLLIWISRSIHAFGGNKTQVTVIGGASVSYHLIAPPSKGWFQKAIIHSGSMYSPWAVDLNKDNLRWAVKLGAALGCKWDNVTQFSMILCLQLKPIHEIMEAVARIAPSDDHIDHMFRPTLEPETKWSFITRIPTNATDAQSLGVPMMIGVTAQEGIIASLDMYTNEDKMARHSRNLDDFISHYANISLHSEALDRIKSTYFKDGVLSRDNIRNITDFVSDSWFHAPIDQLLMYRLRLLNQTRPTTYYYLYNHRGATSMADSLAAANSPCHKSDLGVGHGDDVLVMSPAKGCQRQATATLKPTDEDRYLRETMTAMWVNFAINPNHDPNIKPMRNFNWRASYSHPIDYLRIGNHGFQRTSLIGMEKGFLGDRMKMWRDLRGYEATIIKDKKIDSTVKKLIPTLNRYHPRYNPGRRYPEPTINSFTKVFD